MWNPLKLFVLSLVVLATESASFKSCEDDLDCNSGNFCYLQTQRCTPCVDCGAYQRRPAATCAREPALCGDCVQGFEPEILTNGHTRGLCIRLEDNSSSTDLMGRSAGVPWWWLLSVICGACSFLGMILFILIQKKCRQFFKVQWQTQFKCNGSGSISSSAPFAPSAPPQSHTEIAELSRDEVVFKKLFIEEEKYPKAAKFHDPVWVRTHNNNNSPPNEPVDVVDGPPENAPFLIDENTLPSDWTPGIEYDGGEPTGVPSSDAPGTLVTSFAGILQLAAGPPPTNHTAGSNTQDSHHDSSNNSQGQQQFVTVTNIVINNGAPSATGIFNINS